MYYGRRKYGNKVVETAEGKFDGKNELRRWWFLQEAEREGRITHLRRQVEYTLLPKQTHVEVQHLKTKDKIVEVFDEHPVTYLADFVYEKDGKTVVEDFKGVRTDVYVLKRKMMLFFNGIKIREVEKPGEPI